MTSYFHHPCYFLDPKKCYRNSVEAGTKRSKHSKLSSRSKNGYTWENNIFPMTGLLMLRFRWQMSKREISWPVKDSQILTKSWLAQKHPKYGIHLPNAGDDNQSCRILTVLFNWINQLRIKKYNLCSINLFYTNVSISTVLRRCAADQMLRSIFPITVES